MVVLVTRTHRPAQHSVIVFMNRASRWIRAWPHMSALMLFLLNDNSRHAFYRNSFMPSTVIRSFDYNAADAVLTITFVSGSVYEYYDVPQETADAFKTFREKGIFYNEQIKNKFNFKKVSSR